MKVESLIFDIDGTLWDSRALVAEGYNIQLRKEGLEHLCTDAESLKPLFGMTLDDLAEHLFPSIPLKQRMELIGRCTETEQWYLEQNPCQIGYPGIKQTLEALAKSHRLFIVSNANQGYPELCMEKLGLSHLFEGHLCFGDTGTVKGETIKTLMKRHNIGSAAYIGDTQSDADAAALAEIPFIWASYGFGTPASCDEKITAPADLLELSL